MRQWAWLGMIAVLAVAACIASYLILFAYRDSGTTPVEKPSFRVLWTFEPPERGAIISSPLVTDQSVFVAAIHDSAFASRGAVYCLDRQSGKKLWTFNEIGREHV